MDISFPEPVANDIVIFGSLYAINKDVRDKIKSFVSKARNAGAIVVYDPNFRKAHLPELPELMPYIIENMQFADIVKGSDEDFMMIFKANTLNDAYEIVSKHCPVLIYTMNANGVYLKTKNNCVFHEANRINPVSTIGAGDSFNAGIIFGMVMEKTTKENYAAQNNEVWHKILGYGVSFASEVCLSYDNYISEEFADKASHTK